MGNIDYAQIKTTEQRAAEKLAQDHTNAINTRASEYAGPEGTDKILLEALLKKFQNDPDIAPIWARRQEIQTANPHPEQPPKPTRYGAS